MKEGIIQNDEDMERLILLAEANGFVINMME